MYTLAISQSTVIEVSECILHLNVHVHVLHFLIPGKMFYLPIHVLLNVARLELSIIGFYLARISYNHYYDNLLLLDHILKAFYRVFSTYFIPHIKHLLARIFPALIRSFLKALCNL